MPKPGCGRLEWKTHLRNKKWCRPLTGSASRKIIDFLKKRCVRNPGENTCFVADTALQASETPKTRDFWAIKVVVERIAIRHVSCCTFLRSASWMISSGPGLCCGHHFLHLLVLCSSPESLCVSFLGLQEPLVLRRLHALASKNGGGWDFPPCFLLHPLPSSSTSKGKHVSARAGHQIALRGRGPITGFDVSVGIPASTSQRRGEQPNCLSYDQPHRPREPGCKAWGVRACVSSSKCSRRFMTWAATACDAITLQADAADMTGTRSICIDLLDV